MGVREVFVVVLLLITVALWGYNFGSLQPRVVEDDLQGYKEIGCSDIARNKDGILVCEVAITAEDDDIRIFRAEEEREP